MGAVEQIARNLQERVDILLGQRGDKRLSAVRRGEVDALVREAILRKDAEARTEDPSGMGNSVADFRDPGSLLSGVFNWWNQATSKPPVGSQGLAFLMRARGAAHGALWIAAAIRSGRGANEPRVFFRGSSDDEQDMSRWREILHQGVVVGAVSMDDLGAPAGAVIEAGHDATNGDWIRFADGTQICWNTVGSVATATTASGGVYMSSDDLTWTFPKSFAAGTKLAIDVSFSAIGSWGTYGVATVDAVPYRRMSSTSAAVAATARMTAIGRWAPYPT